MPVSKFDNLSPNEDITKTIALVLLECSQVQLPSTPSTTVVGMSSQTALNKNIINIIIIFILVIILIIAIFYLYMYQHHDLWKNFLAQFSEISAGKETGPPNSLNARYWWKKTGQSKKTFLTHFIIESDSYDSLFRWNQLKDCDIMPLQLKFLIFYLRW